MTSVFWDTAPFIYLIEGHPLYMPKVATYLRTALIDEHEFATSAISLAEFGVAPMRKGQENLIQAFDDFLIDFNFTFINIGASIASLSCSLRAKYSSLKLADAIQLASAINGGCQQFLTNDKALVGISEIDIIIVDDLPGSVEVNKA